MARGFDATDGVGSTDQITTTYVANTALTSWALWVWRTGNSVNGNGRFWQKGTDNWQGYEDVGNNKYQLEIKWSTTSGLWTIVRPSAAAWHHLLMTYDSGSTANDPIIYVDGSSVAVTRSVAPVGTLVTGSAAYQIGNTAGIRVWNGRLAEFGIWNRILTSGEATTLNAGFTPSCIPNGLVAYWPIQGVASPEPELIAAANGTLTGTAAQTHPTVKQPEQHLFGHLGRLLQGRMAA